MSSQPADYDRIIRPIEQQILRSVWRITQNADDAFQEAMSQIWRRLPHIREHPNPSALVLKICTNAACDVVRKKSRRDRHEQSAAATDAAPFAPDATALLLEYERRDQVRSAVARLPEQQATAVAMRYLLSCSYDEIAQALDCAEATARVHVLRGLSRLRDLLSHLHPSSTSSLETGT